jgi:two-component system, NarL family, sensor kinase
MNVSPVRLLLLILLICPMATSGQKISAIDSLARKLPASHGEEKAIILYELVYAYLRVDVKKAKSYNSQVKEMLKTEMHPRSLSYLHMANGILYSRSGLLDSGIMSLNEAKNVAVQSESYHALVRIYASLGHAFISSGKPEKGLENMFEGLKVLENNPDREMEMKLRTNVAWAYLELKQYRNCIKYGLQNIKLMEGTDFEWIALYTYSNVAVSYGAIGIIDSAKFFVDKGIKAAQASNDMQALANAYFILGTIYSNAGKYSEAIEQYLKARPYRDKVGNPLFIVSDLYTISDLYYKTKKFQKGVKAAEEALKLAQQYNLTLKFEGTYESLAKNYEGLKDFRNASRYYRLWAAAKDSVYKNSSANAIAEMQTKFETEKKEQQLAIQNSELLRKEVELQITYLTIAALLVIFIFAAVILFLLRSRIQKKRLAAMKEAQIRATIESQENERKRFAQDLHDGMGQLISALRLTIHNLDTHGGESAEGHFTKAEALLNDMHKEIRSIAFNLMPQTLVKNGVIPALKEVINRLSSSAINITITSFEIPERLDQLKEIALFRILQEWLTNVVKYSNANNIDIQFVGHDRELTIIIEDNGEGFDQKLLNESDGHGWKNIQSRVSFLQAAVYLDTQPGRKGTTFTINIPLNETVLSVGEVLVSPTR